MWCYFETKTKVQFKSINSIKKKKKMRVHTRWLQMEMCHVSQDNLVEKKRKYLQFIKKKKKKANVE